MTINFKAPDIKELKPRILVLGIGGAGGNAINGMIESGLQGVEFIAVNTDAQDLRLPRLIFAFFLAVILNFSNVVGSHI